MNKSTAFKQQLHLSKIWPLFLKMSAATFSRFGSLRSSKHFRRMSPQRKDPCLLQSDNGNGKQIISERSKMLGRIYGKLSRPYQSSYLIYLPPRPSKITREISRQQQVDASCFSGGSPNRLVPNCPALPNNVTLDITSPIWCIFNIRHSLHFTSLHQLAPHISYQVSWLKGLQDQRMSSITWWWLCRFCEGGSQASACKLKTTGHWLGQCVQRICWSRSTSHACSNPQRQGGMWLRGDGWILVDQEFRSGLCQTKILAISCGETSEWAKDRHWCHMARWSVPTHAHTIWKTRMAWQ